MTITLAQLKTRARQRADMESSDFVSSSELTEYINSSIAELHDILVQCYGSDYFVIEDSFNTTAGEDKYALPDDFYKLYAVDVKINGQDFISIKRFNANERNRYSNAGMWNWFGAPGIRYRVIGANLTFSPIPDTNTEVKILYTPVATKLADEDDELNDLNQYYEYVIVDAAIKMLQKEESDITVLFAQKQALLQRITVAAQNRDEGQPDSVSDIYAEDNDYYYRS